MGEEEGKEAKGGAKRSTWSWIFEFAGEKRASYVASVALAACHVVCRWLGLHVGGAPLVEFVQGGQQGLALVGEGVLHAGRYRFVLDAGYDELSADIAQAFHDVLGIPPRRVYVRYSDIPIWSVGDAVFDRRMFR